MFTYDLLKDSTFFKEHTLPAHSDHVGYPSEKDMREGNNPYRHSLNGIWKFSYGRNFSDVVADFYAMDVNCHDWGDIRVPAHIQMEGYDAPAYVNTQYPWDGREELKEPEVPTAFNPVGCYVKYLFVPKHMRNQHLYISFQGVESAFALWLNGRYVGYSEDSFTPSEFELTPYLNMDGENKLAVQVFKWASGSWAEDQDFYRFSGIFRDVYLYVKPETHVEDMRIRTEICVPSSAMASAASSDACSQDVTSREKDCRVNTDGQGVEGSTCGKLCIRLKVSGSGSAALSLRELPLYTFPGSRRIEKCEEEKMPLLSEVIRIPSQNMQRDTLLQDALTQGALPQDALTQNALPQDTLPQASVPQDSLPHPTSCMEKRSASPTLEEGTEDTFISVSYPVRDIRLWSAEAPYLYELLVTVKNERGEITEVFVAPVGFRSFEMKDGLMCLNGKRIVFKGVNRHEFSSLRGRVPNEEELRTDLMTMKRHNINAIRTCHYPNDSLFYRYCDVYGFYVMDENNMETHGSWDAYLAGGSYDLVVPGDKPYWEAALLDRIRNMYERDKNHPCILIWSCGNESYGGLVIKKMADLLRELDDTRLVHYEGIFFDRRYESSSDMESQMYRPAEEIKTFLSEHKEKPFILCEYTHAMGNSCGAMHKYTRLADEYPQYQGGFIWDYIDQTIRKKDRYGQPFQAYGGDFGERPTDYSFSANGIVYGKDRGPSPKMQEVKYNYQNIEVAFEGLPMQQETPGCCGNTPELPDCPPNHVSILVKNRFLFTNTNLFTCCVTVQKDGVLIERASLETDAPPLSERRYELPLSMQQREEGEYAVTVTFIQKEDLPWADRGFVVAHAQSVYQIGDGVMERIPSEGRALQVQVIRGHNNIGVKGEGFEVLFSHLVGGLVSYRYAGVELLKDIPMPNFWRAPVDNDRGSGIPFRHGIWKLASLYATHKEFRNHEAAPYYPMHRPSLEVDPLGLNATITYEYLLPTDPVTSCFVSYQVFGDGTVETTLTYDMGDGKLPSMPEFGMLMKIDADYDQVEWYGLGPEETYADRQEGALLSIYKTTVRESAAAYVVPQETGNRAGVRRATVTDLQGRGLLFEADGMNFSALPWTPHEMELAAHPYELPQVHHTVIRLSLAQMGVGGDDSWGSTPHAEYFLPNKGKLEFRYRFRGV